MSHEYIFIIIAIVSFWFEKKWTPKPFHPKLSLCLLCIMESGPWDAGTKEVGTGKTTEVRHQQWEQNAAEAAGKMRRPVNFRSKHVGDEAAVPSQLTTTGLRLEDASSSPWGGEVKQHSHWSWLSWLINKTTYSAIRLCVPDHTRRSYTQSGPSTHIHLLALSDRKV